MKSNKNKLICPCSYQGSKRSIAPYIVQMMDWSIGSPFADLCCGSGAVALELLYNGFPKEELTMVDAGPYGLFWQEVGQGTFDIATLEHYCHNLPSNPALIPAAMKELAKQSASIDTTVTFLLLQAGSFGGKAVYIKPDGTWKTHGFTSYWLPKETSIRKTPSNPMVPMPGLLLERAKRICDEMHGVNAVCANINDVELKKDCVVYIDPPYDNTIGYGCSIDVAGYVRNHKNKIYVSEGKPLGEGAVEISGFKYSGGMEGKRNVNREEWLTPFNAARIIQGGE